MKKRFKESIPLIICLLCMFNASCLTCLFIKYINYGKQVSLEEYNYQMETTGYFNDKVHLLYSVNEVENISLVQFFCFMGLFTLYIIFLCSLAYWIIGKIEKS